MSEKLLDAKMAEIAATGCAIVATANPGCAIQIAAGERRSGGGREVVHVVELLDRAYAAET